MQQNIPMKTTTLEGILLFHYPDQICRARVRKQINVGVLPLLNYGPGVYNQLP